MLHLLFLIATVIVTVTSTTKRNVTYLSGSQKNSESGIDSFILKQAELCPYISLCNLPNRSASLYMYSKKKIPCCSQCSCEGACARSGTCCPDFSGAKSFSKLPKTKGHEQTTERSVKRCVKVQHGRLENTEGYHMIATCPENFTDNFIKVRCEAAIDYTEIINLGDHIPVTEIETGRSFRNRFCYLCNEGTGRSMQTWEIWLNCSGSIDSVLSTYGEHTPLHVAENILKYETASCNVAFKPSKGIRMFGEIESCGFVNIISTCKSNNTQQNLEMICAAYSWPVRVMDGYRITTYKNYACLQCNNVNFREHCADSALGKQFSALLRTSAFKTLSIGQLNPNHTENSGKAPFQVRTIKRKFQTENGATVCSEGEILDARKGKCRHVTCPRFFYIEERRCLPIFTKFRGVVYQIFLQIIIPDSVPDGNARGIESAIFSEVNRFFQVRMGEGVYKLSLWGKEDPSTSSVLSRAYFLLGMVNSTVFGGQYAEMLRFLYRLVSQEKQVGIAFSTHERVGYNAYLGFRFTTFFDISFKKPIGPLGEVLYLLKTEVNAEGQEFFQQPVMAITQSNLCYRVELYSNESGLEFNGRHHVRVVETKQLLQVAIYQRKRYIGYFSFFVCLNNAFRAVPNDMNYVFGDAKEGYFESADNRRKALNIVPDDKTDAERSLAAVAGTISGICIVIAMKILCARFVRRRPETENGNNMDSDLTGNHENFELKVSTVCKDNNIEETLASEEEYIGGEIREHRLRCV